MVHLDNAPGSSNDALSRRRREKQQQHLPDLPPEIWRLIGEFVSWRGDAAAAARRACKDLHEGIERSARIWLASPQQPRWFLPAFQAAAGDLMNLPLYRRPAAGGSAWKQVMSQKYGVCACGATHWWNVRCGYGHAKEPNACQRVVCMQCHDDAEQRTGRACLGSISSSWGGAAAAAGGGMCDTCSVWYCGSHAPVAVSVQRCGLCGAGARGCARCVHDFWKCAGCDVRHCAACSRGLARRGQRQGQQCEDCAEASDFFMSDVDDDDEY
jgi:hypothetical protein